MSVNLNLHELLYTREGYLKELRVPDHDQTVLISADEEIRATIKQAVRNWNQTVSRATLFDMEPSGSNNEILPTPKFRLQGSFAYKTVNDCQQTPPQQIDRDDGMFLPVGFVIGQNGYVRPRIASAGYFELVEKALAPLCAQRGWILNPGRLRDHCVRVGIGARLHIDIPLYAMKDESFRSLAETRVAAIQKSFGQDRALAFNDAEELDDQIYAQLPELMLADRSRGWIESDPRKLEAWFGGAVQLYGGQIARLCRDFKGLRDAHWSNCDLGSICIMATAVKAAGMVGRQDDSRDDLAVLLIGRKMVELFAYPVENPAFPGEPDKYLCKDWTPTFRAQVQQVFQKACDDLERAINCGTKRLAIAFVQASFGSRVPNNENLIKVIGAAATVRQITPQPQPRQVVPRTQSG